MKTHLLIYALTLTPAFADDWKQQLTQALVDNSIKITEIKKKCNSRVSNVKSTEISNGRYLHTFQLERFFRGSPGIDCIVEIDQDTTPTHHDGPIAYKVIVKPPR